MKQRTRMLPACPCCGRSLLLGVLKVWTSGRCPHCGVALRRKRQRGFRWWVGMILLTVLLAVGGAFLRYCLAASSRFAFVTNYPISYRTANALMVMAIVWVLTERFEPAGPEPDG